MTDVEMTFEVGQEIGFEFDMGGSAPQPTQKGVMAVYGKPIVEAVNVGYFPEPKVTPHGIAVKEET